MRRVLSSISRPRAILALLLASFLVAGCADLDDPPRFAAGSEPEAVFPTSLHATAEGMRTMFTSADGFGTFSGVDYESIGCKDCHAAGGPPRDTCESCHGENDPRDNATCLGCHSRQAKLNVALAVPDYHLNTLGMKCADCHAGTDVHGTGEALASQWDNGGIQAKCEGCHVEISPTRAHTVHGDRLHCSACHTATVVSCYNCHFDTFLAGGGKKAAGALKDWVFLINDNAGRVRAATFQSLTYEAGGTTSDTFVGWAPFEAHSVTKVGRPCAACHGSSVNAAIQDYVANDKITITWWNAGKLEHMKGVIPIVEGKMELQFLSYNSTTGTWSQLDASGPVIPDGTQFYYGSPITPIQLEKMKQAQIE
jgi:hypothetical protein